MQIWEKEVQLWYNIHIQSQNLGGVITAFSSNLHFGKMTNQTLFYHTDDLSHRRNLSFCFSFGPLTLCLHGTSKRNHHAVKKLRYGFWATSLCQTAIETEAHSPSVHFSHLVRSYTLWPRALRHVGLLCQSPNPRACSNSRPSSPWCHPTISSFVVPFSSCLKSFPESWSLPKSQFFASGNQSIGVSASASVLLMCIQDWFL